MTCPRCSGSGCPSCEGSGTVALGVESTVAVTFAEACELVYREQVTGQPFHFLHGKPRLVVIHGQKVMIA